MRKEDGCEQYELFRSTTTADGCVPLERWWDRAALDAHIALLRSGPPAPHCALRVGPSATEVYEVSRCRWRPGRPQEPTGSRA